MRNRLQYTEPIEKYYQRLWNISEVAVRDLIRVYNLNKDIWLYKSFNKWFSDCYYLEMSYKQWVRFVRYYTNYRRRKNLKLSNKVNVNW